MENPTEDQVQAMTNREFASLIRSQAEMIDRSIHRGGSPGAEGDRAVPGPDDGGTPRRRQRQKV